MGGLFVQQVRDFHRLVVELVLFVADILDAGPHDPIDLAHIVLQLSLVAQADFSADNNAVGRGKGLASNPCFGFLRQEGVKNRIRYPVTYLVRVAFRNGF